MQSRRWLSGAVFVFLFLGLLPWVHAAEKTAVQERLTKDVFFLASDECEGRGVNTKGINLAADYIAQQFKIAGLKPAGVDGTYFQPFTMSGSSAGVKAELKGPSSVEFHGPLGQEIDLTLGRDVQVAGLSGSGSVLGSIAFVGYGATAEKMGYDDYKDIDVKGKVVMILRRVPRAGNREAPFEGGGNGPHAGLEVKAGLAEKHGAAAILFVNDSTTAARDGDKLMAFDYLATANGVKIPAFQVQRALANHMLQSSLGKGLEDVEEDIDRNLKPASADLPGWKVSAQTNVSRVQLSVKNIVGVLEGKGPLANETVVVGGALRSSRVFPSRQPSARQEQAANPPRGRRQRLRHHHAHGTGPPLRVHGEPARPADRVHGLQRRGKRTVWVALLLRQAGVPPEGHRGHV